MRVVLREMANASDKQIAVFDRLLDGASEKEIAVTLGLSRHTVHSYVKMIYRQVEVHSCKELMSLVNRRLQQIVPTPDDCVEAFTIVL